MGGFEKQLEFLRRRVARIEARYAGPPPAASLLEGQEVETTLGKHWEIDKVWPSHARHGSADVGALVELSDDLLESLEAGFTAPACRWIFLDTETTGLVGGSGTLAFLIGAGWISPRGFELKQFFIRDHGEEPSALLALSQLLANFDVMVTYNGKAFDAPLLETRFRLARQKVPFERLRHLDLLFSARRLWKLALERCRLQDLESRILGVERHNDVDGGVIPTLFFEFLHTKDARPLIPVLNHNATDVLSLACLTAVVPLAFREPHQVKHAAEMVGLGRWLRNEGRLEEALHLFRNAINLKLSEDLVYHTLWQIGTIEKRLGRHDAAVAAWSELTTIVNPFRAQAYEQLAIYYEHREKNPQMALEMTRAALQLGSTGELLKRAARLAEKASRPKSGRLI